MKKENAQFYEAPEVETIEVRMEQSIASTPCPCDGVDVEGDCGEDCTID